MKTKKQNIEAILLSPEMLSPGTGNNIVWHDLI